MRTTQSERLFYTINYIILMLAGISSLLPIIHIIALSLSDAKAIFGGEVSFWPVNISLESYKIMLENTGIVRAFNNNVVITVVGVSLCMIMTILAAYPLSRSYFIGRKYFMMAIVFTMLFSGGTIPAYLVIKSLGLINSYGALWIPGLISTYNMLVMRTFFLNIPSEVQESAVIDGCNEWRLLLQIILPLSSSVLATLTLFYAVGYWNSFMGVLIYINDTKKYNLAVLVQQMVQSQSLLKEMHNLQPEDAVNLTPEGVKAASIIIMVTPMLVVYPFLQRYFVKGVMLGSVKG